MPSELETSIRRTRRRFNDIEDPARRQMALAYQRVMDRIESELMIIDIVSGGDPEGWRLFRQQRLQRLLTQVDSEFARFSDDGMRIIGQERIMAVRGGAAQAWELMGASGIDTAFSGRINTAAVERVLAATYDGPLRKVLDGYGTRGREAIERLLLQGVATGEGARSISRRIMRELGGKGNRSRIEALTRTEGMRGFRAGSEAQYESMSRLIQGYRWVAAKSLRTCLACLARDGQVQKTPWDQFHVQCRCINSPVPTGSKVPYETGPEWLARQPAATQRKMFATTKAYDAYRAGDVTLADFVGVSRSRVWGDAVFQRSGRDVLQKLGIPSPPKVNTWGQSRHPRTFSTDEDAKSWASTAFDRWSDSLTNEQRSVLNRYKGGDHSIPNSYLRKPKGIIPDVTQGKYMADTINETQRISKALGGTNREVVVYRGVDREVFGDLLDGDLDNIVGTVIRDKGFPSASLSEDYVLASRRYKGVIVETRVPKGSRAVSLEDPRINSYGYDEYEMLLPKGSKMQIVGVEQEPDGFTRIITELLP